jgi:two-component system, OmpR family, sensor histidine kinase KdpD
MHSFGARIFPRLLVITGVLVLVTFLCFRVADVNATTAGFIYLLAILSIAPRWGVVESTFASVAAVLFFNFFFLPPVGTLTIVDPQNWVALLAFWGTSVTVSQLFAKVRRQAVQAIHREREMEQLYSLSRAMLLLDPATPISQQIAAHIARILEAPAVALYEKQANRFYRAGPEDIAGVEELLREAASRGTQIRHEERHLTVAAVRLGGEPIGSLATVGATLSDSALQGIANLAAIGIERANVYQQSHRAEAARQSDEFKSTLLDAIAHEFKTPLTSIKAASTALLSEEGNGIAGEQRELLTVVDEEADRLSVLVTEAIQMARLEAGSIHLKRSLCQAEEIVAGALEPLKRTLEGHSVQIEAEQDLPLIDADCELLQLAFRQLVNNAAKYSPPSSPLQIQISSKDGSVQFQVEDNGIGIPVAEQGKIFGRFYRSAATRQSVSGAGLGLAIAKDIVLAHGGTIAVQSDESRAGSTFTLSIPVARVTPL